MPPKVASTKTGRRFQIHPCDRDSYLKSLAVNDLPQYSAPGMFEDIMRRSEGKGLFKSENNKKHGNGRDSYLFTSQRTAEGEKIFSFPGMAEEAAASRTGALVPCCDECVVADKGKRARARRNRERRKAGVSTTGATRRSSGKVTSVAGTAPAVEIQGETQQQAPPPQPEPEARNVSPSVQAEQHSAPVGGAAGAQWPAGSPQVTTSSLKKKGPSATTATIVSTASGNDGEVVGEHQQTLNPQGANVLSAEHYRSLFDMQKNIGGFKGLPLAGTSAAAIQQQIELAHQQQQQRELQAVYSAGQPHAKSGVLEAQRSSYYGDNVNNPTAVSNFRNYSTSSTTGVGVFPPPQQVGFTFTTFDYADIAKKL